MIKVASIQFIDFDPTVVGLFAAFPNIVAVRSDGTVYVWFGPGDTDWRMLVRNEGAATTIIPYAPSADIPFNVTTYMGFGSVNPIEDLVNWVAPRDGTVKSLRVNVTANTLVAPATYTVRQSISCNGAFAATAISISVGSGVTGCFFSANSQDIAVGDRISLEVATGGVSGSITGTAGLEVA